MSNRRIQFNALENGALDVVRGGSGNPAQPTKKPKQPVRPRTAGHSATPQRKNARAPVPAGGGTKPKPASNTKTIAAALASGAGVAASSVARNTSSGSANRPGQYASAAAAGTGSGGAPSSGDKAKQGGWLSQADKERVAGKLQKGDGYHQVAVARVLDERSQQYKSKDEAMRAPNFDADVRAERERLKGVNKDAGVLANAGTKHAAGTREFGTDYKTVTKDDGCFVE